MSDLEKSASDNFTYPSTSAEDNLKSRTVGLMPLDEFRRRRYNAGNSQNGSGASSVEQDVTQDNETSGTPTIDFKKKQQKQKSTSKKRPQLSFDDDEKADAEDPDLRTSALGHDLVADEDNPDDATFALKRRKLMPNPNTIGPAPRAMTKARLAAEAAKKQRLQHDYTEMQERVRGTEIAIPFVFFDGNNTPGGTVKIKKGEQIWLLLEKCRKLGVNLAVNRESNILSNVEDGHKATGRASWARIGVDDLMLVRGDTIVPHHHDIHYFMINKVKDPSRADRLLFDYSATAPMTSETDLPSLLRDPRKDKIEGQDDDPTYTKVVDRRWYERNKHIYPATIWRTYKTPSKRDDGHERGKDTAGNDFFYSQW